MIPILIIIGIILFIKLIIWVVDDSIKTKTMYTIHLKNLDIFEVSEEVKKEIQLQAEKGNNWYVSNDLILNLNEVTYIQKS